MLVSLAAYKSLLSRFGLRGKKKVQGQWQLYCLAHYIEKLANYGRLAVS
nr:transposase [Kushneria aurantia]